ncbi:hypothetical protein FRB99_004159 [Tulasnella sp. 403]|nr:hypothetical protein FRB99_004159 [Tulasnella sp. 403]
MIDKLAGEDTPENLDKWTRKIVEEIEHGPYADSLPEWVSCTDVNKPLECATRWVEDSNAHVCRFALNPVPKNDTELSSEYYAGAAPIIQQQIAKGGVRLAAMLNGIFVGFSGFEGPRYLSPLLVQEP